MKTNKLQLYFITLFFLIGTIYSAHNYTTQTYIEKKRQLSESMDSLDLIKQSHKRHGNSISEIELKQEKILDSLQIIKKKIIENPSLTKPLKNKYRSSLFFKPLVFFDWVILIVGISALFSGILLFLRAARKLIFLNHEKAKRNKSLPQKTDLLKSTITSEHDHNHVDNSENIISDLSSNHQNKIEENTTSDRNILDSTVNNKKDLEKNVLNAALNGMTIHEISKQFHLSSDHVSLIIKLGENKETDDKKLN